MSYPMDKAYGILANLMEVLIFAAGAALMVLAANILL